MPERMYSQLQLNKIAQDNYRLLRKFCQLLFDEGYWEEPEKILHLSIDKLLDIYTESLLVRFAKQSDMLSQTEKEFICALSDTAKELILSSESDEKLVDDADRFLNAAPILYQLLSLRDMEHNSGTASLFFDATINIMLCMTYLDGNHRAQATKALGSYFDRVSAFLTNSKNIKQSVDSKYMFKKLCHGELSESASQIEASGYDFEQYKIVHLYYSSEQLKPVASLEVETYVENSDDKKKQTHSSRNDSKEPTSQEPVLPEIDETSQDEGKSSEKLLDEIHDSKLDELLNELNSLVGLNEVKNEIKSLINLIKVRKLRSQYHLPEIPMSYHMVFSGAPGTGKTTVARIVGQIYKELGILSKGTVTETDRSGLVAGFVGQTALKVKEVVEKSLGGVLFIDEAYALTNSTGNDFGQEALDTLVKLMEDNRNDLVVIVAGYTKEMQDFLKANTGLVSRFNRFITFPDYSTDELCEILKNMTDKNSFVIEEDLLKDLKQFLETMTESEKRTFGNARGIRNLFEALLVNQANRVVSSELTSMEELTLLKIEDKSW